MTKRGIAAVVRRVCESEYACPLNRAHNNSTVSDRQPFCSCFGSHGKDCPLRDALELAAEEERKARKAKKGGKK